MMNTTRYQDHTEEYLLLKNQFIKGISERIKQLQLLHLKMLTLEDEDLYLNLQSFHCEIHKLAGAAGSYGVVTIENESRLLEDQVFSLLNENSDDIKGKIIFDKYKANLKSIECKYNMLLKKVE